MNNNENTEFTLIGKKYHKSECVSALYNYLKHNNKEAVSILKNHIIEERENYILIKQPRDSFNNDEFTHLLEKELNITNCKFVNHHIRIDQNFKHTNSITTSEELLAHWHHTLVFVDENQNEIKVRVYFYYGICIGVYVREPSASASASIISATNKFSSEAINISQTQLELVKKLIQAMKNKKNDLIAEVEKLSACIYDVEYLQNADHKKINNDIDKLKRKNNSLFLYQQEETDLFELNKNLDDFCTKIQLLHSRIVNDKIKQSKINKIYVDNESLSDQSDYNMSKEEVLTISSSSNTEQQEAEDNKDKINRFKERYEILKKKISSNKNLKDILDSDEELQKLKEDIFIFYCMSKNLNPQESQLLKFIDIAVKGLNNLYSVFQDLVLKCDYNAAIELFPHVKKMIPEKFYDDFLFRVIMVKNTFDNEDAIVKLSRFFFEKAEPYKILVSYIDYIYYEGVTRDGVKIYFSPINDLIETGRLNLFELLLSQNARIKNLQSLILNDNGCTLIEVACCICINPNSDGFIKALLKLNPKIQNSFPFAQGVPFIYEKITSSKNNNKSIEKISENLAVKLKSLPFSGSALFIYCSSGGDNLETLRLLAKSTDILHLILALGCFVSYRGASTNSMLFFSNSKGKLFSAADYQQRMEIAKKNWTENVTHIGYAVGSTIPNNHKCIINLIEILEEKIRILSNNELEDLKLKIQKTADEHIKRGDTYNLFAVEKALLFLAIFLEPTLENHKMILQLIVKSSELYDKKNSRFDGVIKGIYNQAENFATTSIFHDDLKKDKIYSLICKEIGNDMAVKPKHKLR